MTDISQKYVNSTMKIPNKKNKTKKCARNWYWNMSEENKIKMKNMDNNTEKICLKNT